MELFSKYNSVIKLLLESIKEEQGPGKRPPKKEALSHSFPTEVRMIYSKLWPYQSNKFQKEIQEATFSILIDETTDAAHTEQLSFVIRYVHNMQIKEHFLQVCNVHTTSVDALEMVVIALPKENDLKLENIQGQGYGQADALRDFRQEF